MGRGRKRKKSPGKAYKVDLQKKPTSTYPISEKSKPKYDNKLIENIEHLSPQWKVSFIDFDGDWGWAKATNKEMKKIIDKFKKYEKSTWGEIGNMRHNHPMKVQNICNKAQRRLQEIQLDDIDFLYQLIVGGKHRIWGVKKERAFHILWSDPDHTVYPINVTNN
ncbi:MAG: hypothetical protein V3S46_04400 [Nitrospinota bacterium]